MNARSRYHFVVNDDHMDRRGAVRTIKIYTGVNKGKRYPYASARQTDRDRMKAAIIRTRDAWDRSLAAYMRESAARQYAD